MFHKVTAMETHFLQVPPGNKGSYILSHLSAHTPILYSDPGLSITSFCSLAWVRLER